MTPSLPWRFAARYLFSRKSSNAINVITLISVIGMVVGTAALILVMSVFNGLAGLIGSLFAAVDPDLRVLPLKGQTFVYDSAAIGRITSLENVAIVSRSIEGKAGLQYRDRQGFATIRGVEDVFTEVAPIDSPAYLYEGEWNLAYTRDSIGRAVFGSVVAASIQANTRDSLNPVRVFVPGRKLSLLNLAGSVNQDYIFPVGFVSTQKDYDSKYVFVSYTFAERLFGLWDEVSSLEIKLKNPRRAQQTGAEIKAILGPEFQVLDRQEQHKTLYRVMRNEKYVSYLIVVLMLLVASVNIVGSLSMIVLEKQRDISVLKTAGATPRLIRRIFLAEGLLTGLIGVGLGSLIALGFVFLQEQFHLLTFGGGDSFVVDAFPMEVRIGDIALIGGTVLTLAMLAAWYPAAKAAQTGVTEGLRK